ncbi:MAG TPA: response regulator [Polyangiaceae bacterium]
MSERRIAAKVVVDDDAGSGNRVAAAGQGTDPTATCDGVVATEVTDLPATSRRDSEIRISKHVDARGPKRPHLVHGLKHPVSALSNMGELQIYQVELEAQNEELRRMQTELELSRQRYFDLYHLAPVGYFTIDERGHILQVNLRATEMLGRSGESLEHLPLTMFIESEDQHLFLRQLTQAFAAGRSEPAEVRMLQKEGRGVTVWMELRVGTNPAHRAEGRVTISDFSVRKELEKERETLQAQLFHAQKLESIGTLAGAIAHDFNNLLAGIMADLALLDFEASDPSARVECLDDIKVLTQRGAELTRQLLGFARRGTSEMMPLDLVEVVDQASKMFARTHKNISVICQLVRGMRQVPANRGQIEQVLLNLFMNAAQAMPSGGELRVAAEEVTLRSVDVEAHGMNPGVYMKLSIIDNGVGMSQAVQSRMFEPFFTTRGSGSGSGLGLASVQGIVKNHNGFVEVVSTTGKGTALFVYLPTTSRGCILPPPPARSMPRSGIETIMLVDDEEHIAKSWGRTLRHLGYNVLIAHGGAQAVEILEHHPEVSLVILDLIMPGMGGRETFDALRRLAPQLKVLLWSGYGSDGVGTEMLERGCSGFVQKPVTIAELSVKLRELMTEQKCVANPCA